MHGQRGHQRRFQSVDYRQFEVNQVNETNENVMNQNRKRQRNESVARLSISLNQKECCICFDSKPDAVIMECGHGGICYECGKHLLATDPNVCHLCREDISYVLKMDLSTVYSNFIKVTSATFIDDESADGGENNQTET